MLHREGRALSRKKRPVCSKHQMIYRMPMANKHDPISDAFFAPLAKAEAAVTAIYFANAGISLAIWLAEWLAMPAAAYLLKVTLLGSSMVGLILAAGVRLYYWPRAHDKRLADSLSSAFAVNLTEERTTGYFNNNES